MSENERGLIANIKADLFTLRGIGVTIVTNLIVAGALSLWIFVNVQVLGNDVAVSVPSKAAMARR